LGSNLQIGENGMKKVTSLALLLLAFGTASVCSASTITYDVNLTIGDINITGDIATDGNLGNISQGNVVDWNLLFNNGTSNIDLTTADSYFSNQFDLSATATQLALTFPYGGNSGILSFDGNGAALDFGIEYIPRDGGYYLGYENARLGSDFVTYGYSPLSTLVIGTAEEIPTSATPEPSSIFLLVSGLAGMGGMIRRKLKA
jgi:opacity protein-like surface antigen